MSVCWQVHSATLATQQQSIAELGLALRLGRRDVGSNPTVLTNIVRARSFGLRGKPLITSPPAIRGALQDRDKQLSASAVNRDHGNFYRGRGTE